MKRFWMELFIQKLLTRFFQFYLQFSKERQEYSLELGYYRGLQYDCQQEKVYFCNLRTKRKAIAMKICPACSIILGCLHILMSCAKISLP